MSPSQAPQHLIPPTPFLLIEHPAVIQNLDRGIASLGGQDELKRITTTLQASAELPNRDEVGVRLKLRPEDPFEPAVQGSPVVASDLLLRVTAPRRKRRKRRRVRFEDGTEGWEYGEWEEVPLKEEGPVWERVVKNDPNCKVEVVGRITHSVRFREMADFQQTSHSSPFFSHLKSTLLTGSYKSIINFHLSPSTGATSGPDLTRPPQFSQIRIPYIYSYLQNPSVKRAWVDGQAMVLNTQIVPKIYTDMLAVNVEKVPSGPPPELPPLETLDKTGKDTVALLHQAFAQRPIWSRRALVNHFPPHLIPSVRFCVAYVGYMWRGGPWRDTVTIYGLDPRTDSEMRKYQVVFFQMEDPKLAEKDRGEREEEGKDNEVVLRMRKTTHLFTGKTVSFHDGRCYQLIDVTDTLIKSLIDRPKIRTKFHETDGWYTATTLYKIKSLMKRKFRGLMGGTIYEEEELRRILEMESEEDEDGNMKGRGKVVKRPKKRVERLKEGGERRGRKDTAGGETEKETGKDGEKAAEEKEAVDEEEKGEEEEDEDEDEGVNVVEGDMVGESEWRADATDARIRQMMQQMPGMGIDDVEMGDADDFELLGDDDDDE